MAFPQEQTANSTITDPEWIELIFGMNRTESEYPGNRYIHHCFEEVASRHPNRIALVLPSLDKGSRPDTILTYSELSLRSEALSQLLFQEGVKVNTFVALYMERSIEMVVALLAILKCGCAYVPLDPAYPREQLEFMLQDTNASVLISQSHLTANLPRTGSRLILIEEGWGAELKPDNVSADAGTHEDIKLAYINYTSGSTGLPKGVKVTHRGVLRLVYGVDYTRLDQDQTLLQLAPISFDAATFEIWGALLHGARCVLFPYNGIPDPKHLAFIIDNYGVSTIWLTASLFNLVIDVMPHALKNVKEILTGGEALSVPHVLKASSLLPHVQLVNGYGPTESTTFTCCYRIPRKMEGNSQSIPIGRPIANTTVYILDSDLKPMPMGEPGELYIGGDGLAEGYLNRPDLTAERFLANPFIAGERMYKTGDLVKYTDDGNIEFLGRVDDQVKINGFRIELDEIVHTLKNHSSVNDAVVLVDADDSGNKFIAGYVTAKAEASLDPESLKSYLKKKLAAFSVPKKIMVIDRIPLNANGKADRKALKKISRDKPSPPQGTVPARSETEKKLSALWRDILGADAVGTKENFFDIGGTSVLSVRLTMKINAVFSLDLPITRIYQYPTIEALAMHIDGRSSGELSADKIQNRAAKRRAAFSSRRKVVRRI
jgi:amino acid adenylation domain-containing protein